MIVAGFTFIKNAIKLDYPIVEAIKSILPLCDYVVVAVGKSEDDTLTLISNIDNTKVRIIETEWNEMLRSGGQVLADETNKALKAIGDDADWCIYIQGDEVMHEDGYEEIRNAMIENKDNKNIDGLLLKYRHFYGSYDYVGESYRWYRNEIRIIKNNKTFYSYKDAQGFRKDNNQKLKVKKLNCYIHHYGWVKEPKSMQGKQDTFYHLWNGEPGKPIVVSNKDFDYSVIDSLSIFKGKHPLVMAERIKRKNWTFDYDITLKKYKTKERLKRIIEKLTGYRIGEYKNYKVVN